MNESMQAYAGLLFKLFLDRRRYRGRSEFSFRLMRGDRNRYRIGVRAKESTFQTTVTLRRRSSDLAIFEQVLANNAFNLRRLWRWNDIEKCYAAISLSAPPVILDLGANIGLSSIYFAKNWPNARIIAVEPEAQTFQVMCENLRGLKNVIPVRAAAAGKNGKARISNPDAQAWAIRTEMATTENTGDIDAMSANSLLLLAKNCTPFIAKIDIEGFESDLFSINTEWVSLFPVIIIELHDWMLPRSGSSRTFLRSIAEHDRDFVLLGENIVSIANEA